MKPHWRAALFFLPLVITFGVPALVLALGGELTSPDTVVARQQRDAPPVLHGPAYSDYSNYVRMRHLVRRHPQVLALGNSRVLGFRGDFFRPEARFFNAGRAAQQIEDFRAFLEYLPADARPRTLLVALEASFFHPAADTQADSPYRRQEMERSRATFAPPAEIYQRSWMTVWADLYAGKINWARLAGLRGLSTRIGLLAVCNEQGARSDGSYLYGGLELHIEDPRHRDYQFAHTLESVRAGTGRFRWADHVSERSMRELDAFLDYCHEHHIEVICYLPPHAHAVWMAIQALGDQYAYARIMEQRLREKFTARGLELYDFSDLATTGAPDSESIDGYHPAERAYLRMLIAMLEQGSHLNADTDLPRLQKTLRNAKTICNFPIDPE